MENGSKLKSMPIGRLSSQLNPPNPDRRSHSRLNLAVPWRVRWENLGVGSLGVVEEVSKGGFRVKGTSIVPVGTYASFYLSIPQKPDIELVGRLIWREDSGESSLSGTLGVMVLERKDVEKFRELVGEQGGVSKNRRCHDEETNASLNNRREIPTIGRRLMNSGKSLDRWISRYTYERGLRSASAPFVQMESGNKIMLGSNNYLGLTDHPRVKDAAIDAIQKYGTGAGGVRVLSGTMDLHKKLEERIARFKHAEACLIFPSGYVANLATLTSIAERGDVFFNDQVNHASIVDGCRSSEATMRFYKHNDLGNLEKKLKAYPKETPKLIITDGVFSMDGDVAPVDEIVSLSARYGAMVMVDDAHGTGVVGQTGRGSAEHRGVLGKVDITTVTLSKALGAVGGAICGSRNLIKKIFNLSRHFIFTSALPPAVCASVIAALDVIESEPGLVTRLAQNREFLCKGLREMGYDVPGTESAIVPVIIGDEVKTYKLAARLDELGVFVNAVSRPAVPRELSRLRVSVMATHTQTQLKNALEAFQQAGEELSLLA